MSDTPRWLTRPVGHIPAGLLGMVALVVSCEVIHFRSDRYASGKATSWTFAAQAATAEAIDRDVLLLGDSMVKMGLLPTLIEERSGGRLQVYNLAAFDAPPSASDVLLRRALGAGCRASAVVVNLMPHQLARSPVDPVLRRAWAELLTPREAITLARALGVPELPGSTVLGRLIPSVRQREEIRLSMLAELDGFERSSRNLGRLCRRNWTVNLGAHVLPTREEPGRINAANTQLFPGRFVPDPAAIASVLRLLSLARDRGMRFYWLITPLHPEAAGRHRASGFSAAYEAEVRRLVEDFPNVVVLDARHLGIKASQFVDAVHLDRDGAILLSSAVADILAAASPGADRRWVKLARPTPSTTGAGLAPIEDLDQSRTALIEERAARRR
ncbi:MAG TPA: hypothetical protein VFT74_08660 [Isosphaeraceae bacterium]|nr:hypothetical protein [Isosphaeraceae bacterium]